MKILIKTILVCSIFIFFSCKKENVRNQYDDREVITVTGLEDHYAKISAIDKLVITPEVSSNKGGELEYLWGIYQGNVQLTYAVLDTIARKKDLDYLISQAADSWRLVFRVTNKATGYTQHFTSTLEVGTEFTRGWYVLKDQQEKTDLDLFLTPKSFSPASRVDNVYSTINGKKLEGNGGIIRFNSFYKSESAAGVFDNTRSLFLLSEKDASVVKVSTLKEIKDFNSLIFGGPEVRKPAMVGNDFLVFFMVNNGQLHSMIGQGPSFGQFGGRKMKNTDDAPYHLSKYHLMHISSYFFDEISSSFYSSSDRSLYLTPVKDMPGTQLSANNNNKKLLYMGLKNRGPYSGVAIFQDKTDPSLMTINEVFPLVQAFRMTNRIIEPTDKIFSGKNFGLLYQDENMIYFSVGKEVWSRNLSNNFEQLQFTVPTDETITFIQHKKYNGMGPVEAPFSHNFVAVGSASGSGEYKVRMFSKISGNLSAEPEFTLSGTGNPRDVLFTSPGISSGTVSFPDTF